MTRKTEQLLQLFLDILRCPDEDKPMAEKLDCFYSVGLLEKYNKISWSPRLPDVEFILNNDKIKTTTTTTEIY